MFINMACSYIIQLIPVNINTSSYHEIYWRILHKVYKVNQYKIMTFHDFIALNIPNHKLNSTTLIRHYYRVSTKIRLVLLLPPSFYWCRISAPKWWWWGGGPLTVITYNYMISKLCRTLFTMFWITCILCLSYFWQYNKMFRSLVFFTKVIFASVALPSYEQRAIQSSSSLDITVSSLLLLLRASPASSCVSDFP